MADRILIIDDEAPIRKLLVTALSAEGFEVQESAKAQEGLSAVATYNPKLILLDLGLPDIDGIEFLKRLREWCQIPVIVLSARGEETMKVCALDGGANDYITKPFGVPELLARVRVALRAHLPIELPRAPLALGPILIDLSARRVTRNGTEVHLTPIEYNLLSLLVQNVGKVLTHRQLLTNIWGAAYASQNQYLRVYMKNLRHKLEEDPARPRFLVTESGVGYRLMDDEG